MIPDEMLREAIARTYESYISHLLSDYDPEYRCEFSPIFEKKIKKLMRRADHPILYRTLKRIAVILLTLLIAGTVWISVDADARAAFFGWFNEVIGNSFVYHHNESANGNTKPVDYRPLWIPDGYSENTVNVFVDETTVLYKSEAKGYLRFSYIISLEKRTWYLDITDADIKDCCVNAQPAQLFISKLDSVASGITWTTEDSVFLITGFVTEAELIRMAESVEEIH